MENERNHLLDILILIDKLQKDCRRCDTNNTCTRPILGTNDELIYNTRPIQLYLCNNSVLTIQYQDNGATVTSDTFRVENVNDSCVTVRLLANEDDTLVATNETATINIGCIAALRCLEDISLSL